MKTQLKFSPEEQKMNPAKWKVVDEMKSLGYTDKEIGDVFDHCLEMMCVHTEETEIAFAKDCKEYERRINFRAENMPKETKK